MTYQIGTRVKFAAWTDAFMRGERYGIVTKVGRLYIHVTGERSGRPMGRFCNVNRAAKGTVCSQDVNPAIEFAA